MPPKAYPVGYGRRSYAVLLSYDGAPYKGWQSHPVLPTVSGVLSAAMRRAGIGATPIGASRTDAGVHARAQVASFSSSGEFDLERLHKVLNADLPQTVRVLALRMAAPGFHSHWSSTGKIYQYRVSFRGDSRAWRWPGPRVPFTSLSHEKLSYALKVLQNAPDVSALSEENESRQRKLTRAELSENSAVGVTIEFEANGFGKYLVRNLVSAALGFAVGVIPESELEEILARARPKPPRADPDGLTLHRVLYPADCDPFPDVDCLACQLG